MRMNPLIPLASLFLAATAFGGLSVTGVVTDKLGAPLPEGKVCLLADPSKCATTGPTGAFKLTVDTPVRLRGAAEAAAPRAEWRQGRLRLTARDRTPARIAWIDGAGRALAPARETILLPGANVLAAPPAGRGLAFLRVDLPRATYTWKAMLAEGAARIAPAAATASGPMALSRSAAVAVNRDVGVAKAGYRNTYYRPAKDTVENVALRMAALSDSGTVFSAEIKAKVVTLDRAAKTIRTETAGRRCDYEKLVWVPDTSWDTNSYAVRDGKLHLWKKGMCKGRTYNGGTSAVDPIGSWTLDESAAWPADLSAAGCTERPADLPMDSWRRMTLAVTAQEWKERTEFEACTGDMFMALVRMRMGGDSASTLVKNTCKEGAVKDKAGDIATLNYGLKADSIHVTVKFKGKTCEGTRYFGAEQECPDNFMLPFIACLSGMGFAGPPRAGSL